MLFFFKEKPIEITAFVASSFAFAHEHAPIKPAKHFFPKWWKETRSGSFDWELFTGNPTVKSCPGIIDTLTTGFIMPMWCDLSLEHSNTYWKYCFSDKQTKLVNHSNVQAPGFYDDHWIFKIESPWLIKTPVKLIYTQPFYSHTSPLPFVQPYGITTPISGHTASHIFMFAKKEEEQQRVTVKFGTPLMHIIPLTDKKVTFKTEVISNEEYIAAYSRTGGGTTFVSRGIKTIFREKK